ncbi:MAG: hypothetical protein P9L88_03785 [Candidatus Tantalella remota]|nr:hypothetical protein [Candidatus Tantalella remota]
MKKHIQPCNVGGSIYGKKKPEENENITISKKLAPKKDTISAYSKLYENQVTLMKKVFRREQ